MTWCQFHPQYNDVAKALWDRARVWDFDSSHAISEVTEEGTRRRVAEFNFSEDAELVERLVNAFKDGRLMIKDGADV